METWKIILMVLGAVLLIGIVAAFVKNSEHLDTSNSSCFIQNGTKEYVGISTKTCSQIRFACAEGMQYFNDVCGCGCEPIPVTPAQKKFPTYCNNQSRVAQACTMQYEPVCGWYDPGKVECVKAPCANDYSNSCQACIDPQVLYYTNGSC
jgi:hypothetical protein